MTEQESYAEKIAKLLRKAESTTPEEAEALIAKAQELMTKYAIDEAMISAAKGTTKADELDEWEFVLVGGFRVALGNLTYAVLSHNSISAVLLGGENWRTIGDKVYKQTYVLRATGFKSDLERARLLDTSLQVQASTALAQWWREHEKLYGKRDGFLARRQFLFSYAAVINTRLAEGKRRGMEEARKQHGSGMELVLRDRSDIVKAEFEKRHPNLRSAKQRQTVGSAFAAQAGRKAASRAGLGNPSLGNNRKALN